MTKIKHLRLHKVSQIRFNSFRLTKAAIETAVANQNTESFKIFIYYSGVIVRLVGHFRIACYKVSPELVANVRLHNTESVFHYRTKR